MNYIYGTELFSFLENNYRAYLCGDLKKTQELKWIHDTQLEIGISNYSDFTADAPHEHTNCTEYNFILCGSSKVLIIDKNEEKSFEEGSLIAIPPKTKYATKHKAGTKVLFIKHPGGNDKKLMEITNELQDWLNNW